MSNVEEQVLDAATRPAEQASSIEIIDAEDGKIGGQIKGVDVKTLSPDSPESRQIREAIYRNKLVTIPDQDISTEQYLGFIKAIGKPQVYFQPQYHHPDHPEVFVSSNMLEKGKKVGVAGTGRYWHTDCAFEQKPLPMTSIRPIVFPQALRGTYYMNMARVYNELPDDLRDFLNKATAIHEGQMRYKVQASDIDKSLRELLDRINEEVPPVEHPAVITHPVTGEKSVYVSSGFTTKIKGLKHEENQEIMQRIWDFSEQEQFIHLHSWQKNDIIIWDNRCLNHMSSATPKGEYSKSHRIGLYDDYPFYVGLDK